MKENLTELSGNKLEVALINSSHSMIELLIFPISILS